MSGVPTLCTSAKPVDSTNLELCSTIFTIAKPKCINEPERFKPVLFKVQLCMKQLSEML